MEGRILTCVYCGHEYPQDTPAHGDKVLTDHIAGCEKHPMRAVIEQRDKLRAEVERLRADGERLDHIEKHARCDPKMDGQHVWWPTNFKHALRGATLRAAIDLARTTNKD